MFKLLGFLIIVDESEKVCQRSGTLKVCEETTKSLHFSRVMILIHIMSPHLLIQFSFVIVDE